MPSNVNLLVAADSDLARELASNLVRAGLDDELARTVSTWARRAVAVESSVPEDYAELGNSRLGGFPDLADPSLFPKTDDQYWSFLAQINLADVAAFNDILPRTGLLSFFIDSTDSGGQNAKVIFQEDGVDLMTTRHGRGDELYDEDDDYTALPHKVTFHEFASAPYRLDSLLANDQIDAVQDAIYKIDRPDHLINGFTVPIRHESPEQRAAEAFGGEAEDWLTLLSLGWDDKVGFCFWDAGIITYCIAKEALERKDFSNVFLSLESS